MTVSKGFVILSTFVAFAIVSSWDLMFELAAKNARAQVDQLGNVYLIKKSEIIRYNSEGVQQAKYSDLLLGEDIQLDVTNPMKVLLFSPSQLKIQFLDSRLGLLQEEVSLLSMAYDQVTLAATSHSNGFWLYDQLEFNLIRMNQNMQVERKSLNLARQLKTELEPNFLIEVNNQVYLNDPKSGIHVFDIYGAYLRRLPILGLETFRVSEGGIYYQRAGRVYKYNLQTYDEKEIALPIAKFQDFDITALQLVLSTAEKILVYKEIKK